MVKKVYRTYGIDEKDTGCLIFNADETGFASDPSRLRAIGGKGKSLQRVSDGSGRESTTVLACVSASGAVLPPLIVYKGAAVQPRWISEKAYPETMYAATSNGWMEEATFFNWFSKMFVPYVKEVRMRNGLLDKSAVLFYDGHASHISIRIIELAFSNNVQLVKFPSHLTDRLQPLDKCVFGPVKTAWGRILVNHGKTKMGNGPSRLAKKEFAELLGTVWSSIRCNNIVHGFISTGLFPLDESKVPEDMFEPQHLVRYRMRRNAQHTVRSKNVDNENCFSALNEVIVDSGFSRVGEIVPCDDNEIDMVLDLSLNKPKDTGETSSKGRDLVEISSQSISSNTVASINLVKQVGIGTRLKHHTYGEVLTSNEVPERLMEAEENKKMKRPLKKKKAKKTENAGKSDMQKKAKKSTGKERKLEDDSDCEEEQIDPRNLTSDDDEDHDTYLEDIQSQQLEEVTYTEPAMESINPEMYILVELLGGSRYKTQFRYVCRVDEVSQSNEIEVTGLKSVDTGKSKFVIVENDQFSINFQQVKAILPIPNTEKDGRKTVFNFQGSVNVKEI